MEGTPKQNNMSVEELRFSQAEGLEVLQNLEISEKNQELFSKMAEIETEMKSRRLILKTDPDTGEILKEGGTEFEKLKEDTFDQTRKELTNPSKYFKGAVIAGVVATLLAGDYMLFEGVPQIVAELSSHLASPGGDGDSSIWLKAFDIAEVSELVLTIGAIGLTVKKTVKLISQEIKTKVVSNKKIQRIVAMMAEGMGIKDAQKIVGKETKLDGNGYISVNDDFRAKDENGKQIDISTSEIRAKLIEMGIKPISREKYKG